MSSKEIPFYTQTNILDRYIHKSRTDISSEMIEIIVELLNKNTEIRNYFFRNTPHPDWAIILWDKEFFKLPPNPVATPQGYILPPWDVQGYLMRVAHDVPDIVIKHVNSIEGSDWYISQALRALNNVPLEFAENALPRLLEFLNKPVVDRVVADYIYDLMLSFAKNNFTNSAFALFESFTEPVLPNIRNTTKTYPNNVPGLKSDVVFAVWKEKNLTSLFCSLDNARVVSILEKHVRSSLILEERDVENPYYKKGSSWRAAIEDSDQNHHLHYPEILLENLRDAINTLLQKNDVRAQNLVRDYLVDKMNIFRRLAIHFVREYPMVFVRELQQLLSAHENLEDYFIRHEFFLLLRDRFSYLDRGDQQKLIAQILLDPSENMRNEFQEWRKSFSIAGEIPQDEYIARQIKHWKFGRLWMIQQYLDGEAKIVFNDLLEELGEPEIPPEFTSYSTGVRNIEDISPLSRDEIIVLSPTDLITFLTQWKPENNRHLWPHEQTHASLGREVAKVIFENPTKYKEFLFDISIINSGYGYGIVDEFCRLNQPTDEIWQLMIVLCEKLLEIEEVRLSYNPRDENNWYYLRSSLVRMLGDGFSNEKKRAPSWLLPNIQNLLLILVNDLDPNPERDQPPKDQSAFNDPSHVALNAIRPIALNALITYSIEDYKIKHENYTQELGPERLSGEIRDVLNAKLDLNQESSWAIRSLLGQRLINLFWLDREWVEKNLDRIFPTHNDDESKWLFSSAFSSYVVFRNFFPEVYVILKPKYEHAISCFSEGYIWKNHLLPVSHLAGHLIWNYLSSDYSLNLSKPDDSNLFVKFFRVFDSEGRKDGAFICRRVLDYPENVEKYWDKIRKIWEWRVQEAIQAGHTSDFDEEILQFAQLVSVVPEHESIESLWPLLTATVPHLLRIQYNDVGWDAIEEFLAKKVDAEPLWAIRLYTMMYGQVSPTRWMVKREETRKIIETSAKSGEARQLACDLINYIGSRLGDDSYRDIFEKYC